MVIGAARDNLVSPLDESLRHGLRVTDNLLLIIDELWCHRLLKRNRLGGNHVH